MCSRLSQWGVLCLGSALPAICIQVSFVRTRARFKQRRLGPLVRMCGRVPPRVGHFKDYLCREDAEIARNCCERRTFISVCAICVSRPHNCATHGMFSSRFRRNHIFGRLPQHIEKIVPVVGPAAAIIRLALVFKASPIHVH